MPRYVIERKLPGAGQLTTDDLRGVAQKSNGVLKDLGSDIRWEQSYVTDDTIYCVYEAPSEELILEHARRGGFPADRVSPVRREIGPRTAEEA
jgi:uncharacterized protein DUF4242